MTNDKFIKSLTKVNPLAEIFIIDAIYAHAQHCKQERLPDNHIIDADAWQRCAKELSIAIQSRK
jgi:hypothetical protein